MTSLRPPKKSERARYGLCGGWGISVLSTSVISSFFFGTCVRPFWRKMSTTFLWGRTSVKRSYCLDHVALYLPSSPLSSSAVGRPERRASRSFALSSSDPAIREAQQLTGDTNSTVTAQIFNRLWMFVTNCFAAIRNSAAARCLWRTSPYHSVLTTPAHARGNLLFRGAAVPSGI